MAYANEMANDMRFNFANEIPGIDVRFGSFESDVENYRIGEFYTARYGEYDGLLRDLEISEDPHEPYPYYMRLRYVNSEGLGFCDFMCSVEDKILRDFSRNRAFAKYFRATFFLLDRKFGDFCLVLHGDNKFAVNGLPINDIVRHVLKRANDNYHFWSWIRRDRSKHVCPYQRDYPHETKYTIDNIDGIGVNRLDVEIYIDKFRLLHKRKSCIDSDLVVEVNRRAHKRIFNDEIREELMIVTWHPDRFLDWCVDIEELKFLEELWGVEC